MGTAVFAVFRDGMQVSPVLDYDGCVAWVEARAPSGIDHAMRWLGYDIRRVLS